MSRIYMLDAGHTLGVIEHDGKERVGPIPPQDADVRALYERLLSEGVVPEPFKPPAGSPVMLTIDFLESLTPVERKRIRQAAKSNSDLEDWLDLLLAAGTVDKSGTRMKSGMAAMVTAGLLTQARADELMRF